MYRIIQNRKIWYSLSALLIGLSIIFISLGGLKFGIDFTGGSLMQLSFNAERPSTEELIETISPADIGTIRMQTIGDNGYVLRFIEIDSQKHQQVLGLVTEKYEGVREESFAVVGPIIGEELRSKAITAIILVLVGIILYIMWAFRSSSREVRSWKFGLNAILALVHDVLLTIGFFAALGYFLNIEIDILFVTALLTILGFSVHDTIVVFDRIREGLKRGGDSLEEIANSSVNRTLVRSINTTTTTLLVLLSLFLFGGASIHYFILALIFGMVAGTYSSIFIASPLLVSFSK